MNGLSSISKEIKAIYNQKIVDAAVADIPNILRNAKAANDQVELAQKVANEQSTKVQVEIAKEVAKEQVKKGQGEVNQLTNLSKERKNAYNEKIVKAAVADIPEIIKEAKAEDYQVGVAKKVPKEQKAVNTQVESAKKVAAEKVKKAQNEINKLSYLSKEKKADYYDKLSKAAVADIAEIVRNAIAEDYQIGIAQNVAKEQVKKAQAEVNQLANLSKEQKAKFNKKIAEAAVADILAIVNEAKDLDAKQTPKQTTKLTTKKQQISKVTKDTKHNPTTTTDNGKSSQPGKDQTDEVKTEQKTDQNIAKAEVTKDETKVQQKNKSVKKQLPETGEQDQVLFGMLAGSLFASAGTLFLVQARRKENE